LFSHSQLGCSFDLSIQQIKKQKIARNDATAPLSVKHRNSRTSGYVRSFEMRNKEFLCKKQGLTTARFGEVSARVVGMQRMFCGDGDCDGLLWCVGRGAGVPCAVKIMLQIIRAGYTLRVEHSKVGRKALRDVLI
jgi:hypothetical protein